MLPYEIRVESLIWDLWNIDHIARHDVTQNEVEEVCERRFIVRRGYAGRYIIIGHTPVARALAVVVEPVDNEEYYVVTARPASRRERRIYQEETR